ncbi:MAG: PilN domain-containing protein [Nitriliruptoraceae bacterium]
MSVRVNLLPQVSKQAETASRVRWSVLGFAMLVLVGLGVASFLQFMARGDAEEELTAAQAERAAADAEVAELQAFAELEQEVAEAEAIVSTALGGQASLAGVLQDLALATPEDVALTGLSIDLGENETGGIGLLRATAETVDGIAPGVERYLRLLEQLGGFDGVYLASASTDEDDVTSFDVDLVLGPEHLTGRFDGGVDASVLGPSGETDQ